MRALGSPIVYRVPEDRHAKTILHDKSEVTGSAYHPELTEFAGIIVAVKPDNKFDVLIFPPNRTPTTINDLPDDQIEDPGTTHMTGKKTPDADHKRR